MFCPDISSTLFTKLLRRFLFEIFTLMNPFLELPSDYILNHP
jgi:hypothetical protein